MGSQSLRFYGGVFLVTAATLMLQVIQTRILSVVTWYHLAFFAISIAMFGLTAGAVWVYLRRDRFTAESLSYDLAYYSGAFAVSTALSLAIQMTLSPLPEPSAPTVMTWLEWSACLAVPFFFSGVVVSLALTRSPYPIGRVYGVDLAGAALGCLAVLALLNVTDGPSAVLWVAVIPAVAAILFSGARLGSAPASLPPFARLLGSRRAILVVLALAAFANGLTEYGFRPIVVRGRIEAGSDHRPMFEEWSSFSRVAVFRDSSREPQMWGPSPTFREEDWSIEQRLISNDGAARTHSYRLDGDIGRVGFLKYDVTTLAYYLPGLERAAIVGVGGGRDVLGAKLFGVPDVVGIEINPTFVRLLVSEPGHAEFSGFNELEGARLVVDEARSWCARTDESFDIIQVSMTDTWAATGAGAFSLSENGLYTVEAWKIFLGLLTENGVLSVSRWHDPNQIIETGRILSLAVAALLDVGVTEPARHIFMATAGRIVTLVVSRSQLSASRVELLGRTADDLQYGVIAAPDAEAEDALIRGILSAASRAELDRRTRGLELDMSPPTDDRPFFFNQLPLYNPWKTLTTAFTVRAIGVARGNLVATGTLVLLVAIAGAFVIATIVLPLRPAIQEVGRDLAISGTAYFLLVGLGFMFVEIGLLQRMSVFLGHPIYSLSIVLFSMILFTGLGSLLSDRIRLDTRAKFATWALALAAYLVALPTWMPKTVLAFESETVLIRALICVSVIGPAGLLMGFGFPTGMRLVEAIDSKPTPWFWGINGAAGVLASGLAVAVSIAFGISVTLRIGAICYLLLIVAAGAMGFGRPAASST